MTVLLNTKHKLLNDKTLEINNYIGEVLNKLKSRGFLASSLSSYDCSTLYTTLPHNRIKDKLVDLIERTFQREGSLFLRVMIRMLFLHLMQSDIIIYGLVRKCVKLSPFS